VILFKFMQSNVSLLMLSF